MKDKIITPNFGGGGSSGGGEPPKPPTYEELLFAFEQQKDMVQHLKNLLLAKDEEHSRLLKACELAKLQLDELAKFYSVNAQVAAQAAKNFETIATMIAPR